MRRTAVLAIGATLVLGLGLALSEGSELASAAPPSPGPAVCGSFLLLSPYSTAPAGAVTVPAGDDSNVVGTSYRITPNTTYWFAPGTHTLGTSQFGQIVVQAGDTFIGAPGAIIDGQSVNESAFDAASPNVTIEYLTIENFVAPEGQMVVNHDGGANWTIQYNTIEGNGGAGVGIGSGDVVSDNCLTGNAEYGFSSFGGSTNVTLANNEISYNDGNGSGGGTYDQGGSSIDCGCSGGGKFWNTTGALVTDNYVHDNGNVGIWVDTDNAGFDISNNYISRNYAEGIIYEISYNAQIANNTFVDNSWGAGPNLGGFPDSALYISESGGDSRVAGPYSGSFTVSGNVFTDNWGGVVLYENANRACGLSNDAFCTLIDPSTYTLSSCAANLASATASSSPDYFDNCRWKTQNVMVTGNTFNFTPSDIGSGCTEANWCGFNGLFSEYGSKAPFQGWVVPNDISNSQNNHFENNSYSGPWSFDGFSQGESVTWAQWTEGYGDTGSGDHFGAQDAGGTFRIYGPDAIGTAIAVSQQEYPTAGSANAVVLARSDFFSDALAGGPLAAAMNGPLLITPGTAESTTLDPRVEAEIQRVLPTGDDIYVLGGDLALSPNIDVTLEGLGYDVIREAGNDEYATSVDIAEQLGNPSTVFEATGLNFYDALSAVPAAIENHAAILLTDGPTQAPETATYLAQYPGDNRYAIGGPLAAGGADPSATKIYGQNLYATSAAVASRFFPTASIFGAVTAADFPDALGGGLFMATSGRDGALLLVNQSGPLPVEISSYLATLAPGTEGDVFGGPLAVGADVVAALQLAVG